MIKHSVDGSTIRVETSAIEAEIRTEGYTSGVGAGSFVDKRTGARDAGFGLSIVDFLLEPADRAAPQQAGQYEFGGKYRAVHGDIPKRYVEGPQICTQAKKLPYEIAEGKDFLAVRQWFTWSQGYPPHSGGSRWEQTIIFLDGERYFLSSDRVTSASESSALFFRVDMPGHIKHRAGDSFEHVYLSYSTPGGGPGGSVKEQTLPATDFSADFPPDGAYLYQRGRQPVPQRFIRAYQVKRNGGVGPWLAGMTLEPADVYEAWCHQRGYVCMIQELGGWPIKKGDTFGAAYVVGWFDSIADMRATYDRYRGWSGLELSGDSKRPSGVSGLKQKQLPAVPARG